MSNLGRLLIETITDSDPAVRDRSVRELTSEAGIAEKLEACRELIEQLKASVPVSLPSGVLPNSFGIASALIAIVKD